DPPARIALRIILRIEDRIDDARAVELPAMIRTRQMGRMPIRALKDAHPLVRADVIERLEAQIVLPDDENRLRSEIADQIVARPRRLVSQAADVPGTHPHAPPLTLEILGGPVTLSGNGCHPEGGCRHTLRTAGIGAHRSADPP